MWSEAACQPPNGLPSQRPGPGAGHARYTSIFAIDELDRRQPHALELAAGRPELQLQRPELWVAARTDPELREQLMKVEPAARASVLEFVEAAFGERVTSRRFRRVRGETYLTS
jgi:hypothetical protein